MKSLSPDQSIRLKYEDVAEISAYTELCSEGLTLFESALVEIAFCENQLVLDIGCGGGREALGMARAGLRVTGIDLVHKMVQTAQQQSKGEGYDIPFLVAKFPALPFHPSTFDGVMMLGQVIAHTWGQENRVAALRSIMAILKPGGTLAMTTHNRRCHWKFRAYFACVNPLRRIGRRVGLKTLLTDNDRWCRRISPAHSRPRVFVHMYDLNEAVADLRSAGFEVIHAKTRAEFESSRFDQSEEQQDYLLGFIARRPLR